ncbi:MAG: beta-propeller fold lactonase family protein [Bacteroidota bacterium]
MKIKCTIICLVASFFAATSSNAQMKQTVLPNNWKLSPIGNQLPLQDLPLNIVVSPNKKFAAITNNGQSTEGIHLIDIAKQTVLDYVTTPKSWYGLSFSADNQYLYASGGNDNWIMKYKIEANKLKQVDTIVLGPKWPTKISPAGICINDAKNTLYVVTKDNNKLYEIDLVTKKQTSYALGSEAYTCLLSADKKQLYISLWGTDQLLIWDTETKQAIKKLAIGDNPNELLLTKNGSYLYVANANDNSVAVVDTKSLTIVEVLNCALFPNAPNGSTTNGLALNETESRLYVANADNNNLAVFDVTKKGFSSSIGFIPTGWYPTNLKIVGNTIFVTNGKGLTSFANPNGPNPIQRKQTVNYQSGDVKAKPAPIQFVGGLFKGTLSIFKEPTTAELTSLTKQVYLNTPYNKNKELSTSGMKGNPIPQNVGDSSPIKHVFYIIKENRTYDQVLSDLPQGNGDSSLLLFGRNVTPNQHAVAEQFVLLDNFYADAEVSADGHSWSMAAYANDYNEKTWVTRYGGRGGNYVYEGQKNIAFPKGGFLWDHALKARVSFRTYGQFADDYAANYPTLEGKFCPYYTGWDESVRDTSRFYQWKRDFDSLYAINQVPALNTMRFINDHTEGTRIGKPTPFAHVADNDYAVGVFIEYLSKHPIWDKIAIFILEDDAQNGADHVDAHRSPAYVAGGFVKRGFVDHTMYSTSSMLRTIELILGLPPMSQYDAAAEPMWRSFDTKVNKTPFNAISPLVDLNEKNIKVNALSKLSESLDFSKEDKVPDLLFNQILWKAIKGENSEMPAPKRSAFIKIID